MVGACWSFFRMFEHRVLTYNGCRLDRAMDNRCKPEWLADRLARSDRRMVALWQDRCLLLSGKAVNPGNAGIQLFPTATWRQYSSA